MKITWPSLRISMMMVVFSLALVSIQMGCVGVDRQVQFPPSRSLWRLSQVSDVNPQPGAIDEQVDRPIRR